MLEFDEQTREARNAGEFKLILLWLRWTFSLGALLLVSALGFILQKISGCCASGLRKKQKQRD